MKNATADRIHDLALELHEAAGRATRAALREHPDGADRSLERQAQLAAHALRLLETWAVKIAADLFAAVGEGDAADAVDGQSKEIPRLTLAARMASRVCEGCGCTDFLACPGGCTWVEETLCSRCKGRRAGARSRAVPRPRR